MANDRRERMYLYDGKTFTLFAKRLNYYATVPAPPTIGQLADKLDENYGIGVPLSDLFRWGTPGWSTERITGGHATSARAPSSGTTCQHYAFRQDDIDWQIWIQKGDNPLPRKLVITTKTDEARPQHLGRLHLEPRALVQRRHVHVRPAGRRRQGRARRDQGRRRGDQVGDPT